MIKVVVWGNTVKPRIEFQSRQNEGGCEGMKFKTQMIWDVNCMTWHGQWFGDGGVAEVQGSASAVWGVEAPGVKVDLNRRANVHIFHFLDISASRHIQGLDRHSRRRGSNLWQKNFVNPRMRKGRLRLGPAQPFLAGLGDVAQLHKSLGPGRKLYAERATFLLEASFAVWLNMKGLVDCLEF